MFPARMKGRKRTLKYRLSTIDRQALSERQLVPEKNIQFPLIGPSVFLANVYIT